MKRHSDLERHTRYEDELRKSIGVGVGDEAVSALAVGMLDLNDVLPVDDPETLDAIAAFATACFSLGQVYEREQ